MSDLIKREDAIAVLMETMTPSSMLDTLVLRMEELPYEDYMKVVRCKDCGFGVCPNCGADMRNEP